MKYGWGRQPEPLAHSAQVGPKSAQFSTFRRYEMAQQLVRGAIGLAALGLVIWGLARSGGGEAGAPAADSALAPPASAAAPTAMSEVCRLVCEHSAQGRCPADPKGAECFTVCEKARATHDGRCTEPVDALLLCIAKLPAESIECGPTGTSQPVSGACQEQVTAMQACVTS